MNALILHKAGKVFARPKAIISPLVLMLVMLAPVVALACPTCRESLAQNDPAHANLVRGYFWSILFMMSMPFLILGGLSALFWWEVQKAKRNQQLAAQAASQILDESPEPVVEELEPLEV